MPKTRVFVCALTCASFCTPLAKAVVPWPVQSWGQGINLTVSAEQQDNLSGAYYNATQKYILAVRQDGKTWRYDYNSLLNSWLMTSSVTLPSPGDFEGITMFDEADDPIDGTRLLLLEEGEGGGENDSYIYYIKKAFTAPTVAQTWKVGCASGCNMRGEVGAASGPEAIAFIPNNWLTLRSFVDRNGLAVLGTTRANGGLGGLVFVGHQIDGFIYVFDLKLNGTMTFIGTYDTSGSFNEIADMSFDNSNGLLYILHGAGSNSIEVTNLISAPGTSGVRILTSLAWTSAADNGIGYNIEGLAVIPPPTCAMQSPCGSNWNGTDTNGGIFLTCDTCPIAIEWMRSLTFDWIDPALVNCPNIPRGDLNCDGVCNGRDIQLFMNLIATGGYSGQADMDQNGVLNQNDRAGMVSMLMSGN